MTFCTLYLETKYRNDMHLIYIYIYTYATILEAWQQEL